MELNADENLPEFFKVYVSHLSSHKMLIPGEFVDYMEGKKSGPAELFGPSGHPWRVELVEDGKDVYFSDGWQAFIKENMVRDGDFVFFKFHGDLVFNVVIYDESMCEKGVMLMHVGDRSHLERDGTEAEQVHNGVKPVKKRVGCPEADDSLVPSEDRTVKQNCFSFNPSFEKCLTISNLKRRIYSLMLPSSFVQEHSLSYNSNEKMVLQTGRDSSWEVTVINYCGAILLRKGISAFARDNNIRAKDVCKFELLDRLKMFVHVAHRQEGTPAAQKRSLKKAVGVSQSKPGCGSAFIAEEQKPVTISGSSFANAAFVTCMKKYNVGMANLVNIPSWFIREHSLYYNGKETVVLRTTTDSWLVNIIHNKNKYNLNGGWAAFVRDNNIKEGDTCKFELVNRLEMKVEVQHNYKHD